ncbi:MAG: ComF family protein [Candidatus Marinimicrobia bacterium]|nr:ComF family protein [Candidatus Neomarinimicrobiota bacterium]
MYNTNFSFDHAIRPIIHGILDLIYPPLCLVCEKKLTDQEDQICFSCLNGFQLIGKEHDKFSIPGKVFIEKAWALFVFDSAFQGLIHHLKYSRRRKPVLAVLKHFQSEIMGQIKHTHYDWIVSIPLHPRKMRERGYNQVDGMNAWLCEQLGTAQGNHLVRRLKYTESQTKLNAEERQLNVAMAFGVVNESEISGRQFLLVDDVLTTGATANELAEVLINSGAQQVDLITLSTPQ